MVTPEQFSKEWFAERLGPEAMADIERQVAAAPPPSPELIAKLRRLFAAVPDAQCPEAAP